MIKSAELITSGDRPASTAIDPALVADKRSRLNRLSSARLSVQVSERTIQKSMARLIQWRQTVITTEKKRLRKNVLDL